MDVPIWFSIASAIFLVVIAVFIVRFVLDLRRRVRSGEVDPDDTWDPFA